MKIKSTRFQTTNITLTTRESAEFDFIYNANIMRWFYNVRVGGKAKNGYKLNCGVNLLNGVTTAAQVFCVGNFDFPFLINDFESDNFKIIEVIRNG